MEMNRSVLAEIIARTGLLLCVVLLLPSCASQSEWATRVSWDELDATHLPGQAEYPDAGAIILLDEGRMEIIGSGEVGFSAFEQHKIVKIFNDRGHRYANVVVAYTSGSQVEDIQARTISPAGKITVLDEKNIFDVSLYPNFVFFSDQRAKLFTLPAVDDGAIVEYRYRLLIRNRTFWHSWRFQSEEPTLLSRFTLVKPSEWEVAYRTYAIDVQPHTTKVPAGFKSTYVWEVKDIPAMRFEFGMPPQAEWGARLALSPVGFKTWADVAQWYYGLASPRMKAGDGVKALMPSLTGGVEDKQEKLKRIYEWVRDRVRYVAVEIGVGGYQPHAAEEVLVNRYGDCKDMTTLLCALGKEAGLEVHQVLVSTWQNGKPDTSLPSPLHFNHAIAYCPSVGEKGTWMDATEKGSLFRQLPWYDQGLPVLVVGEKGEETLAVTPRNPAEDNREALDWRIDLQPSGAATVQGSSQYWGTAATELRDELDNASPDERRLWLETLLVKRCSGALLDSVQITGVNPASDPLVVSYRFHTATFATRRGAALVFRPGLAAASGLPDYFRSPVRLHPIRFNFGMKREVNLAMTLPHGWRADTLALADSTTSSFGTAQWQWRDEGDVLHVNSSFLLRGDDIPPNEYKRFQEFLDRMREKDLREVVLIPDKR